MLVMTVKPVLVEKSVMHLVSVNENHLSIDVELQKINQKQLVKAYLQPLEVHVFGKRTIQTMLV